MLFSGLLLASGDADNGSMHQYLFAVK